MFVAFSVWLQYKAMVFLLGKRLPLLSCHRPTLPTSEDCAPPPGGDERRSSGGRPSRLGYRSEVKTVVARGCLCILCLVFFFFFWGGGFWDEGFTVVDSMGLVKQNGCPACQSQCAGGPVAS